MIAVINASSALMTTARRSVQDRVKLKPRLYQGVGALDGPAASVVDRDHDALGLDPPLAAEIGQQFAGDRGVVARVKVHRDLLRQRELETPQLLQRRAQERGVVPVRAGHHTAQRDPASVGHPRPLDPEFSPVNR
ncbi:hypothetical protein HEK616_35940 [Streptomyces nigrescens]|uniref:Uncharacterized protein n=1 Tax=Streptomyces nigrescens TaxID=1920 RepID=A0ABM7ZUW9_STRNI|nr:hypothetical protein HEK616_35940 [Streptomyces nigrescens]